MAAVQFPANGSNTGCARLYDLEADPAAGASRSTLHCMTRRVRPRRGRAVSTATIAVMSLMGSSRFDIA